jgi:hypothetical protein
MHKRLTIFSAAILLMFGLISPAVGDTSVEKCRKSGFGALIDLINSLIPGPTCTTDDGSTEFPDSAPQVTFVRHAARPLHVAVAAPPPHIDRPLVSRFTIVFDRGSTQLNDQAKARISEIVTAARTGNATHISVFGFADPGVAPASAKHLAMLRASAVRAAIVGAGFDRTRISATVGDPNALPAGDPGRPVAVSVGD